LSAFLKPNPVFYTGANLSTKAITDVVKVVDGTNGNMIRLDGNEFASFESNPNLLSSVGCEYAGEAMYFVKGSNISNYGTITLTYDKKPDAITTATSTIDLLPEHLQMFTEELCRWIFNYMAKPVPAELENPLRSLEESFKRSAESMAMKIKTRNIPAKRN
jgi:hypothetical protein